MKITCTNTPGSVEICKLVPISSHHMLIYFDGSLAQTHPSQCNTFQVMCNDFQLPQYYVSTLYLHHSAISVHVHKLLHHPCISYLIQYYSNDWTCEKGVFHMHPIHQL